MGATPSKRPRDRAGIISIAEFLRLAKVSRETWRRQSAKGRMPAALPGGIPREEALEWLQARADAAAAAAARLRPAAEGRKAPS